MNSHSATSSTRPGSSFSSWSTTRSVALWYEMRKGTTDLRNSCAFLALQATDPFSAGAKDTVAASVEVRNPTHREKRDPRDLHVLDPACGSGHFLLYSYDVLDQIYEEAWDDEGSPPSYATGRTLRADYPDRATLRRSLPGLILTHNLFGVDIDLRATQIAALALWLRAQRSYQQQNLRVPNRQRISHSNIVCAEPMPGERELLEEFVGRLRPTLLGQLVRVVFDKMTLAGETGCLLRIDHELRDAVAKARKQWAEGAPKEQLPPFS